MTRIILSTTSESKHLRHGREREGLILIFFHQLEDVQNFHDIKKYVRPSQEPRDHS